MKKYYSLAVADGVADLYIYGDITSWEWLESDVSSYTLSQEIRALEGVTQINVYINSYGGEVAEGLAIYNMLKRRPAKVTTYADGFACSIASVIFMAGDERVMSDASLLMIHNAWTYTVGNADDLRKEADDLETITQASISAYMSGVSITQDELKELLDNETWLTPQEALEKGFATSVAKDESNAPSQSVKLDLVQKLLAKKDDPKPAQPTDSEISEGVEQALEKLQTQIEELKQQNKPTEQPKERLFFNFKEVKND